jgi:phage replication O-like protein O
MTKAQLENGYTKIANELLEKIYITQLTTYEFRVLLAIARFSYGWRQKTTGDRASGVILSAATKLRLDKVYLAIRDLKLRRIITAETSGTINEYKINTDIEEWKDKPESSLSNRPESGRPESSLSNRPESGLNNRPDSGQIIDPNRVYATSATLASEAGRQTPKEIKEIKERKERENLPPDYYQKTLKALGLPETAILAPEDHQTLIALFKENCNFDDIKAARIRRKKNKLSWIQDTVCEERDKRLAGFNDLMALQAEADRLYGGN